MRRRLLWLGVLAAGLGLSGAGLSAIVSFSSPSDVALYEVKRGAFVRRARGEGYLQAVSSTPITVPSRDIGTQYTIAWIAEDGARLRSGDVVVEFDPTELEKSLMDGHDDRAIASVNAEKARAGAAASRDNLSEEARLARLERKHADEFNDLDPAVFSRFEIIESSIDTELAAERAEQTEHKKESTAKQAAAEIELHEIQRNAAVMKIDRAEKGLSSMKIRAPHDGILVIERRRGETLQAGDTLWEGQKVAEIPDMGEMEAVVFVLESDAGGLEAGLRAAVSLAARPEVEIPAEVLRVDALAKPLRRELPVQYFETVLKLSPPADLGLKPGQRVWAEIILEETEGALAVPRQAIFEKGDERFVYRAEGGRLEPAVVKVGSSSLGLVLIEAGLEEGQRIALRDPSLTASEIFRGTAGSRGNGPVQ